MQESTNMEFSDKNIKAAIINYFPYVQGSRGKHEHDEKWKL